MVNTRRTTLSDEGTDAGPSTSPMTQRAPGHGRVRQSPPQIRDEEATTPDTSAISPERAALQQQLETEREYRKLQQDRLELAQLLQDRTLAERLNDFSAYAATTGGKGGSSSLPKRPSPRTYDGRTRASFNRWTQDCGECFAAGDQEVRLESGRVNFAVRYLDDRPKQAWEAHKRDSLRINASWAPTMTILQELMLRQLGSPQQRSRDAYQSIKNLRQGRLTPEELRTRFEDLWDEIGEVSDERKLNEFEAALNDDILAEYRRRPMPEPTIAAAVQIAGDCARYVADFQDTGKRSRNGASPGRTEQSLQKRSKKTTSSANTGPPDHPGKRGQSETIDGRVWNWCEHCDTWRKHKAADCYLNPANSAKEGRTGQKPPYRSASSNPRPNYGKPSGNTADNPKEAQYASAVTQSGTMPQDRPGPTFSAPRIHVNVALGQKYAGIRATIDPGSAFNVVSWEVAQLVGLKPTQPECLNQMPAPRSASGHTLEVKGSAIHELNVQDSNGTWKMQTVHSLIVDNCPEYYLLGQPYFKDYAPHLDARARTMIHQDTGTTEQVEHTPATAPDQDQESIGGDGIPLYVCVVDGPDQDSAESEHMFHKHYLEYDGVQSPAESAKLPQHGPGDLEIQLEDGKQPPYGPLYNLSPNELQTLRTYLDTYLERGWIRPSRSPAGSPTLFVQKKDGSARLCVDYRGLNNITIKNRHPLPLIQESLDQLAGAQIYTRLDVREAYHRLRIREGDEWKTAFRTRYGHFEYCVVPFGLTNAPAAFQAYINQALRGLIDVSCVVYLDDILIFSGDEKQHIDHVKAVLARLLETGLYIKLSKCEFHTRRTEFLGYVVTPEGTSIDPGRVATVTDWPEPTSVRDVRVFIGFVNYYRRFIANFSQIVAALNEVTKKEAGCAIGGQKQRNEESRPIELPPAAKRSFEELKATFLRVPILRHYAPAEPCRVETDASGDAICGILSQPERHEGKMLWKPVAFHSRKLNGPERNYETHDQELLAIMDSLTEWRHYLQGAMYPFTVITDHDNLKYFMVTKRLNGRQARWATKLANYDFTIEHRPGKCNPADGPSRRPDYIRENREVEADAQTSLIRELGRKLGFKKDQNAPELAESGLPATKEREGGQRNPKEPNRTDEPPKQGQLGAKCAIEGRIAAAITRSATSGTQESEEPKPTPEIRQQGQIAVQNAIPKKVEASPSKKRKTRAESPTRSETEESDDTIELERPESDEETPSQDDREQPRPENKQLVEDTPTKQKLLLLAHDSPHGGHMGVKKTWEKINRHYTWPNMRKDVENWVSECVICQRSTIRRHKPYGLLQPIPPADEPFQQVTMDFITDLPESEWGKEKYDAILVIIDRFTKHATYIRARKTTNAAELARLYTHYILRPFGVPKTIISDRGTVFTSNSWKEFQEALDTEVRWSTAYHPQTDGQTERQNQTLEQYLRCFCNFEQDNWACLLDAAEFAYNDSYNETTKRTPFQALRGRHPTKASWPARTTGKSAGFVTMQETDDIIQSLRGLLTEAAQRMAKYYNQKHLDQGFQEGDQVLLSSRFIKTVRPSRKLDYRYRGPFTIIRKINPSAYRLDLPVGSLLHPVFHVSLLEKFKADSTRMRHDGEVHDTLKVTDGGVWEVDRVAEEKREQGKTMYKVLWKGFPLSEATWEPAENLHETTIRAWTKTKNQHSRRKPKKRGRHTQ